MKAKTPDTCSRCSRPIEPGDEIEPGTITRSIDTGGRLRRTVVTSWQHTTCGHGHAGFDLHVYDEAILGDPTAHGYLCPNCFTYHRGECLGDRLRPAEAALAAQSEPAEWVSGPRRQCRQCYNDRRREHTTTATSTRGECA